MSGAPGLRYREHVPAARLGPFVECVWMVWDPRARPRRAPEHIVPDGCPELIVHLADPFSRRHAGRWRRQPRLFLAGTLAAPWTLRAGPRVRTLGIRFRPGAFPAFFPTDMARHADREVPLAALMPAADARGLATDLGRARTPAACFRVAEAWLRARMPEEAAWASSLTRRAVARILEDRGRARIEAVGAALGVSRRRLERAFARDLGIRPKLYARIVRLNAALAALGGEDRVSAVDAALDAGYFDQAHLARDFRAVAGRTARAGRGGDLSRALTRPARLLAMLAGE